MSSKSVWVHLKGYKLTFLVYTWKICWFQTSQANPDLWNKNNHQPRSASILKPASSQTETTPNHHNHHHHHHHHHHHPLFPSHLRPPLKTPPWTRDPLAHGPRWPTRHGSSARWLVLGGNGTPEGFWSHKLTCHLKGDKIILENYTSSNHRFSGVMSVLLVSPQKWWLKDKAFLLEWFLFPRHVYFWGNI